MTICINEVCKDNEIPLKDRECGIVPQHNYSVVNINSLSITLYDSITEKEIKYPIEKFKKYFSKLYWAKVD